MLTIRPSKERGHADHGWLVANHTFSFADFYDPEFMGFSSLRVLNQDRIQAAQGFGTHGHRDMEIVTYVLDGILEHKDSLGNGSRMRPGDVQFMSAGRGVTHSEFNPSKEDELHLIQMWVLPSQTGTEPLYAQEHFTEEERRGKLLPVISPDGAAGSIQIGADARLWVGLLDGEESSTLELAPGRSAWVHLARGELQINGQRLGPGDGVAVQDERELRLDQGRQAEVLLWDLPAPK